MQIFILALVIGLFVHDQWRKAQGGVAPISLSTVGWLTLSGLLLAGAYTAICKYTCSRLGTVHGARALRRLDRTTTAYRVALLGLYGLSLWQGGLTAIRQTMGDGILLDEVLVIAVPLGMLAWGWWVYYPIDRRLREAPLMRRLDQGLPVGPIWTRSQYVISQIRHQGAITLIPLLMLIGNAELIDRYAPVHWALIDTDPRPLLMLVGAAVVFLLAPAMVRVVWDTQPLPAGDLRDRLAAMCKQYRLNIRQLLLWRTFGCLINGAVIGAVPWLRYILLTDGLLENMPRERVEAVMAHELAHIRYRHIFWLMTTALATMGVLTVFWTLSILAMIQWVITTATPDTLTHLVAWIDRPDVIAITAMVPTILCWVFVFGWVSRRFERQADTFAVQHIATSNSLIRDGIVIDPRSIGMMTGALQQVADLNHISTSRRSWRHGSIAWRQAYLRSLRDQPVDPMPIDRQISAIKWASGLTLGALIALQWCAPMWLEYFAV